MSAGQDVISRAYALADSVIGGLAVGKAAGAAPPRDELAREMLPAARQLATLAASVTDLGRQIAALAARADYYPDGPVGGFDPARFAGPEGYEMRAALRPLAGGRQ